MRKIMHPNRRFFPRSSATELRLSFLFFAGLKNHRNLSTVERDELHRYVCVRSGYQMRVAEPCWTSVRACLRNDALSKCTQISVTSYDWRDLEIDICSQSFIANTSFRYARFIWAVITIIRKRIDETTSSE